MKIGVLLVYLMFGIFTLTNRVGNVLFIILLGIVIFSVISIYARVIHSDRLVSICQKYMKNLLIVEIIGVISMLTWNPLLQLIF